MIEGRSCCEKERDTVVRERKENERNVGYGRELRERERERGKEKERETATGGRRVERWIGRKQYNSIY